MSSAKQIQKDKKKREPKEIQHIESIDFWHAEYVKRKYINEARQQAGHENIILVIEASLAALPPPDYDYYNLRCMVNAYARILAEGKSAYNLSQHSKQELDAIGNLFCIAFNTGYYPWDILSPLDPQDLVQRLLSEGVLPSPPLPFGADDDMRAKALSYFLKEKITHQVGESFVREVEASDICRRITPEERDNDIKRAMRITEHSICSRKLHIKLLRNEKIDVDDKKSYAIIRKKISEESFFLTSNLARAIGLMLYDQQLSSNMKNNEVVEWIFLSKIEIKNNEFDLQNVDDSVVARWLSKTKKCIEEGQVLSFK